MLASITDKQSKTIRDGDIQVYSLLVIVFGSLMTVANRNLGVKHHYKHGPMISFLMFFGEYLNYLPLIIPLLVSAKARSNHFEELVKERNEYKKKLFGGYIFFSLPGLLDVIALNFQNFAILLLPASLLQTLLGGSIITGSLVSRVMLGRKLNGHQMTGVILATLGFGLAGLSSCLQELARFQPDMGSVFLGILFVIFAMLTRGILSNTEELIFHKYCVSASRATAIEGAFGLIWVFVFMVILSFFKCPHLDLCRMDSQSEDPVIAVKEIFTDSGVLIWTSVLTLAAMIYNFSFVSLTKEASCIYSFFCAALNTVVIWIASLAMGLESPTLVPFLTQLAGFLLLLLGNLIYNKVITINRLT